jgi:hypothetical protein
MTRPYRFHLLRDGNEWCAVGPDFIPAGIGETKEEAVNVLQAALRRLGWPDHSIPALSQFTVHDHDPSDEVPMIRASTAASG